ncbi:WD40 domain-containing protein [Pedobacter planticolens]|nr:caspase family protein [Pedobacter planticolens]
MRSITSFYQLLVTIAFILCALSLKAQDPKLVLPISHHGFIKSFKFSPNGKLIATGSSDKTVKIWDVKTGNMLYNFTDHKDGIEEIAFSPDGKLLATTASDATVKIWETSSGKLITNFKGDILGFSTVEFSKDGKDVLTADGSGTLYIWSLLTKKLKLKIQLERSYSIYGESRSGDFARYTYDGNKIITNTQDSTIAIYSSINGKLLNKLPKRNGKEITEILASPNSKYLLRWSGTWFYLDVFDLETGKQLYETKGTDAFASGGQFTKDNQFYITQSKVSHATNFIEISTGKLHHSIKGDYKGYDPQSNQILVSLNGEFWITDLVTGEQKIKLNLKSKKYNYWDGIFSQHGDYVAFQVSDDKRENYAIDIYSITTGQFISTLNGHTIDLQSLTLSPDAKTLLIGTNSNYHKLWNTETLTIDYTINTPAENFESLNYSPKGKYIVSFNKKNYPYYTLNINNAFDRVWLHSFADTKEIYAFTTDDRYIAIVNSNDSIDFWDLSTETKVSELPGAKYLSNNIKSISFNKKNDRLLVCYGDSTFALIDPFKAEIIHKFKEDKAEWLTVQFTPDSKHIVSSTYSGDELKVWDPITGKLLYKIKAKDDTENLRGVIFNFDGSRMASFTNHYEIAKVWDFKTRKPFASFAGYGGLFGTITFFPTNNKLLTSLADDAYRIWDANGKLIKKVDMGGHTSLSALSFSTNKLIAKSSPEIKFFNLATGVKQYSLLCIDSLDYIAITPSGYYKSSSNASKYIHYLTKDQKIITFEQLDVKYNRPDKVLESIGSRDTALIKSYKKAYQKRITKLGIDTTSFKAGYSVPEADFINRDIIETEQKKQLLTLKIKGTDDTYNLDRFNVWVNESPVFGLRGISLKKKNSKTIDTTLTITLSDGENQIETSITNVNGTESYRIPLKVNYIPEKNAQEKLYFVGIGIDKFEQNSYNLQWSVKDIRDQANALKLKYGENLIIDTLFNQQVITANIKQLKEKLKGSSVNDKVIIAYSGHGLLNDDFDYFLSTYNVNFDKPEQNGLPYDMLEDLLDNIPARKKLMLIDACHSGEVDKEELLKYKSAENVLATNKTQGGKGVKVINTGPKKAGMKTSLELMQQLFANVGRSTGSTIISAAAGTQFALEKNDLQNGVFSYSILEYMKANPHATVTDLKKYVNKRVVELTAGLQVPTTRNETNATNWEVW